MLKYKDYCTTHTLAEGAIADEALSDRVLEIWRASLPLNRFLQRAMEEVKGSL